MSAPTNLVIDITTADQCNKIVFTDNTLELVVTTSAGVIFGLSTLAYNAYAWGGNFGMNDIVSTELSYQSLDGGVSGSLFSGTDFLPSTPGSCIAVFNTVSVGATLQVFIDGIAIMPVVTSTTTDVVEFIDAVVAAINASNGGPVDFQAYRIQNGIVIFTTDETGAQADGRVVTAVHAGIALYGTFYPTLLGRGNGTSRSIEVANSLGDGIYQMTYQVTDGTSVAQKNIMFFNDCNVRSCIMGKVISAAKQSGSCCSGCGAGIDKSKVTWLYAQLEAAKAMFEQGQYGCADTILRSLKDKCENLCYSC